MEELGIVGISWRHDGSEALARFAPPEAGRDERLRGFAQQAGLAELAYLDTCNRVELIFARTAGVPGEIGNHSDLRPLAYELLLGRAPEPGEAERSLKAWQGEGACEHLFLVAAGLDSAAVGEVEIAGQVRACRDLAADTGLSGPRLELLFDEALSIAARVRGTTRLGHGRVSLAEVAVARLRERMARTPGAVALVGVSAMTERAARSLAKAKTPLIFVNRTLSKARTAAQPYSAAQPYAAEAMPLADFLRDPPAVEAVLSSTGAPEPLLTEPVLERVAAKVPSGQAPLFVDMAVPENIDSAACEKLGLPRIGMDEIVREAQVNREARLLEAAQARELVDEALPRLRDRFAERVYGPMFGALQNRYRHTAREGVRRLLKKDLKGLGDAERQAIETWAEVLARRFAHIPTLGLRGLLHHGPDGSLDAFLQGLDEEFAEELRLALDRAPRKAADHPRRRVPDHPPRRTPARATQGAPGQVSRTKPDASPSRDEYGQDSGVDAGGHGTRADTASQGAAR